MTKLVSMMFLFVLCSMLFTTACDTEEKKDIDYVKARKFNQGFVDGCTGKVAYQTWMIDGEADATLLYLNGRTEYTDKYHHLVEAIDQNWNIIMFDFFGQGRTVLENEGQVPAHADDFDTQHVCDTKKIVDELVPAGSPLLIAAHSMGAFVATRFIQKYPDVAIAHVFSSPMYGIPVGDFTIEQAKTIAAAYVEDGKGTELTSEDVPNPPCESNEVTHDCELYDKFKDDEIATIGPATFGWVNAALIGFDKIFEDKAKLTKPLLIFQAGQDTIVLTDKQDELCESHVDCTLIKNPDNMHENFNELNRNELFKKMIEFFLDHLD